MELLDNIVFDSNGLIPAIVQDARTGEVLMLAYMNRESLEISLKEKRTCFYSRSRQELWRKGETSGNTQTIVSMTLDCDNDSLLVSVIPAGPACHTEANSCYFNALAVFQEHMPFSIDALYALVKQREQERPEDSYTTYLFTEGLDKILKKVGEESTEVVIAAKNSDTGELIYEASDLVYHMLVLLVEREVSLEQIREELAKRFLQ